jgi:hypothetical protein
MKKCRKFKADAVAALNQCFLIKLLDTIKTPVKVVSYQAKIVEFRRLTL